MTYNMALLVLCFSQEQWEELKVFKQESCRPVFVYVELGVHLRTLAVDDKYSSLELRGELESSCRNHLLPTVTTALCVAEIA
jgi:hypothetical protein